MATFKFELVNPERLVLSAAVDQVDLPGTEGDFGILAGHAPFVSTLKTGVIRVREAAAVTSIYVRGGFADVSDAGLTVLAERAMPAADLTPDAVAAEIAVAEAALAAAGNEGARLKAEAALVAVRDALAAAAA
jgi:F-type H+-transporting ATPase subunit epsilon